MKGSSFSPRIVTIDNGTKLTWINNDSVPHKISSYKVRLYDAPSREIFSSPTILPGESYSFTFVNTKDLDRIFYRCEITPSIDGINPAMMGIIYIKDKEGRIWIND
jgi:plastocyanin